MPFNQLESYRELDRELARLKTHFEYFQNAEPGDLVDWAVYFRKWAERAQDLELEWAEPYARLAGMVVKGLTGSRPPREAFDLLIRGMRGAQMDIQRQVERTLRQRSLVGV